MRGRADALLGLTVLEFKSDLRVEAGDARTELQRYLADREGETGQHFVGIATDGAEFLPFRLRRGQLEQLAAFRPSRDQPRSLLGWLGRAIPLEAEIEPTPEAIRTELGRDSLAYAVARSRLSELYEAVRDRPDVRVKRQLWARLLQTVYGQSVDQDDLFFQHTYLTTVAKTMATKVLGVELPSPAELLSGKPFADAGIYGAVESDFFDWVLAAPEGVEVVQRITAQVGRFRLDDVRHDVLRVLYESLIDPEQRHDLGEYYTPDWLAEKICRRAIVAPLEHRVLDPACGSGSFLFHAARHLLVAAEAAGIANADALERCTRTVLGVDIHPVAVIIARVTYLLALGEERLRGDRRAISLPVYLGDSLQWNTEAMLVSRTVRIDVPDGPSLHFPWAVTQDPGRFDQVVETMLELSEADAGPEVLQGWLASRGIGDDSDRRVLVDTYGHLRQLRRDERNHIWGYVARNLARPIWLSGEDQRAHVLVGNPPWLSYRHMSEEMQEQFRSESIRLGIWVGGRGRVSHQDLSGYFFARCVELYLRDAGNIAFLFPYAVLSRHHFRKFLTGKFASGRPGQEHLYASVRFTEAWAFDERVQPLFEVPSAVLIAQNSEPGPLPQLVTYYFGQLPRRDATLTEAEASLRSREQPWPQPRAEGASWYEERFRQGAIIVPRMLFVVERVRTGRFGADPAAPAIISRRSAQEKRPWRDLPNLRGRVERQFLRPLYLGESIAPFRVLGSSLAVIPWNELDGALLDEAAARHFGFMHLARWLGAVEKVWRENGDDELITPRLDYFGQLSAQMPLSPIRIVYAKAGAQPAAAVLRDAEGVIDHKLYWCSTNEDEGHYLEAIFNSEQQRARIAEFQSRGQWGARDFDKALLGATPRFDALNRLHRALAEEARRAEVLAAQVAIPAGMYFVRARQLIRQVLNEDGVTARIDNLVAELLGTAAD